jgi:predicted  nucleic acid-binding Zn-ribbon protein
MSSPGLDEAVTVGRRGVHVEKSFAAEEFPVPAIKFVISSSLSEPVDVRLTDEIPAGFPMDAVGFHPDYESEHWTAYKDNRVEYERRLDPGEEVVTVYGIRIDEPEDARAFLAEPTVEEVVAVDAQPVEAVIGDDGNQVVRDALTGENEMPGLGDESSASGPDGGDESSASLDLGDDAGRSVDDSTETDDDAGDDGPTELDLDDGPSAPEPRAITADTTPAVSRRDADDEPLDRTVAVADEPGREFEVEATGDAGTTAADSETAEADAPDPEATEPAEATEETEATEASEATRADAAAADSPATEDAEAPTDESGAHVATSGAAAGGLAAALADEIRSGDVADEDLAVLREELDVGGVPRSVDVRIRRLQSQVDDLDAYTGALEEFLDEEGTGRELIDGFRADVTDLSETVAEIESRVADGTEAREELEGEVGDLRGSLDSVRERVDEAETTLAATEERVGAVESRVEGVDERVATVSERTDEAHGRLDDVAGTLDDHTEWLEYVEGSLEETDGRLEEVAATADEAAASAASLDEEMGEVRNDVADVDAGVVAVEEQVDTELRALREELADVQSELEELEAFRDRLSDAFGT